MFADYHPVCTLARFAYSSRTQHATHIKQDPHDIRPNWEGSWRSIKRDTRRRSQPTDEETKTRKTAIGNRLSKFIKWGNSKDKETQKTDLGFGKINGTIRGETTYTTL